MSTLDAEERLLWHGWKRATDAVMARIASDLAELGVSGGDFGVLSRIVDLGRGALVQHALAESMGWEKTRLSHHLSRMEERGLVKRRSDAREVVVTITARGRALLRRARPVHARAVRRSLVERLTAAQRKQLAAISRQLC